MALSVIRDNDIRRVQMSNITPHAFRHTYCSNQAKAEMNPKTLQYLMGHSDISVTMNVYTTSDLTMQRMRWLDLRNLMQQRKKSKR